MGLKIKIELRAHGLVISPACELEDATSLEPHPIARLDIPKVLSALIFPAGSVFLHSLEAVALMGCLSKEVSHPKGRINAIEREVLIGGFSNS
jgi:hypothetical protein